MIALACFASRPRVDRATWSNFERLESRWENWAIVPLHRRGKA